MKIPFMTLSWTALALTGLLFGQDPPPQDSQPQADPPSRVARLNYINGSVSFRPGSQEEWGAATLNYPLTTGDHLWTDEQAGAEMHIGSTALRVAGTTEFAILTLDDRMAQVSVSQGFLNVRVRRMEEGETFEVDTPNGAISLLGPGDYRVDVNPSADVTTVTVRGGRAEVAGGGQSFGVDQGQQVRFTGADTLTAAPGPIGGPDAWDEWCITRDRQDDDAAQRVAPYVGSNMIGAEDLADNGQWRSDPSYGNYWVPTRVEAGWAPYRYGHWAYVVPWGWTWIDDAPWGFAPFHYGRWAMIGGAWGWVPGRVVVRPVYAPALVAFVGGSGFSVAVGFGGGVAAWVPLGPREVYRPYYRVSDVYVRNVNITHVNVTNINVTNVTYVNRTYVTAVRQETFVGARPVYRDAVHVPPAAFSHIERVDAVAYRPGREAYLGRPVGGARVVIPPRQVVDRTVIVNHTPRVMPGRTAMVQYRPAPPVSRRMETGPGGYHPAGTYRGNTPQPGYMQRGTGAPQSEQRNETPRRYGEQGRTPPPGYGQQRTVQPNYQPQGGNPPQRGYERPRNSAPPTMTQQPTYQQPSGNSRREDTGGQARGRRGDVNSQPAPRPALQAPERRVQTPPPQPRQERHVEQPSSRDNEKKP